MTGIRAPGPDITIHEGEEGVAVGIDKLTGAEEVVVGGHRNVHNRDARRSHKGAVPMTFPLA
jgi:hypothetical protein